MEISLACAHRHTDAQLDFFLELLLLLFFFNQLFRGYRKIAKPLPTKFFPCVNTQFYFSLWSLRRIFEGRVGVLMSVTAA